jgi:hypothetical protein
MLFGCSGLFEWVLDVQGLFQDGDDDFRMPVVVFATGSNDLGKPIVFLQDEACISRRLRSAKTPRIHVLMVVFIQNSPQDTIFIFLHKARPIHHAHVYEWLFLCTAVHTRE